jgi:hypothetical protein
MSPWRHHVGNHPVVAYLLGGFLGGTAGLLFATDALGGTSTPSATPLVDDPAAGLVVTVGGIIGEWLVVAGGIVAGWFVVALILSWAPGRIRCPRCGTSNEGDDLSCRACQMALTWAARVGR